MFNKTQELILVSLFSAIILILAMVPNVGYISLGVVSITIIHIPVLIGAMTLKRLSSVLLLGTLFGLGSLFAAWTRGSTPVDLAFINPLISVIPRILFALVSFGLFKLTQYVVIKAGFIVSFVILSIFMVVMSYGLFSYLTTIEMMSIWIAGLISIVICALVLVFIYIQAIKNTRLMFIPITSLLGTLMHTVLVLSALVIVRPDFFSSVFSEVIDLIYTFMITNGLIEAIVAVLVVTPVVTAIHSIQGSDK